MIRERKSNGKRHERPASTNTCRMCAPLGAVLAWRGIDGTLPLVHGGQGCSTYLRRFAIGHFREPLDVACSNVSERAAIFGGGEVIAPALFNAISQYQPQLVAICTTCVVETIGDDVPMLIRQARERLSEQGIEPLPEIICCSTPSYGMTHVRGWWGAVTSIVEALTESNSTSGLPAEDAPLALFAPLASPADWRGLLATAADCDVSITLVPDGTESLDGGPGSGIATLPRGGTPLQSIRALGSHASWLQLGGGDRAKAYPGPALREHHQVAGSVLPLPVGVAATDAWVDALIRQGGGHLGAITRATRGRVLDLLADCHKTVKGARLAIQGDGELGPALVRFAHEIGAVPAVLACDERLSHGERDALAELGCTVVDDADYQAFREAVASAECQMVVGSSRSYPTCRALSIPLIRVGFPVADRVGSASIRHLGYDGAYDLVMRIANTLIEEQQRLSVGYMVY
ncbi:MAG: hypothetical protein EA401_11050 [Planctomycetota bacterium]|nr:MAG: hypothetical protein EA401_11050 [Planctomycetota bacterium]